MGMTLYWTVSEGGEKIFKTQMKNAGDTVKMREDFKEYLLKNGIGEDDLNQNTLLVSKKNPFYTASCLKNTIPARRPWWRASGCPR